MLANFDFDQFKGAASISKTSQRNRGKTTRGVDRLDLEIDRPLLGIAGRDEEDHCVITQVFPGLPAARSGVRPGDMVLAVDGHDVASFAEVARIVLAKEPGDRVRLQLERKGKPLLVTVVLANIRQPLPGSAEPEEES